MEPADAPEGALTIVHIETGRHLYGGALQVYYLLRGLAARGVRNMLVCPKDSEIATAVRGVAERVHAFPMAGDLDLRFIVRLRRVLREARPDLLHLHSRRGADVLGGLAGRLQGIPTVLTRRVDNPEPRLLARLKYGLYDRVITISEGIREVLVGEGVPARKIACVRSAVDTARYRPGCDRERFRASVGLAADDLAVGLIAQLIERKGHRYLLEAMPAILAAAPRARFLLFGQGPLEAALRRQAERLGVADRLVFAGFRDDLERLLPCLDLVVHPADMEGLGVSLLQAAACGVPIVASAAGGIPEVVRDGVNGYLIRPGDVRALGTRVVELLRDLAEARRLGAAGRKLAEAEFSLETMVDGNLRVYRELLAERQRAT